jgi:hypothetical protein
MASCASAIIANNLHMTWPQNARKTGIGVAFLPTPTGQVKFCEIRRAGKTFP